MASESDRSRRSVVEHNQKQLAKHARYGTEDEVEELIAEGAVLLREGGRIDAPNDLESFAELDAVIVDLMDALSWLGGDRVLNLATEATTARQDDAIVRVQRGHVDVDTGADRSMLRSAFDGCVAIAEALDVVESEKRNRVHAHGLACKTGEHLQDWDMNLGDEVETVTFQAGTIKSLYCGGTGFGKSAGLEAEAEDFYQKTFREGRDYKVIDLVDLSKGESWVYDVPAQHETLRRLRTEQGLPADFTESFETVVQRAVGDEEAEDIPYRDTYDCPQCAATFDDLEQLLDHGDEKHAYHDPDVEIYVPLTPGIATEDLPFDTDDRAFTVTPFVVPASDLRKPILIPCILSRVSEQQENTIRQAYDDVDRRMDDWSLVDLADEIRERDELSPKHKADAVGVLRSLQDEGFIRTQSHDMTLDWREIFYDTETITVFSQALVPDARDIGQMICVAYLVDKMLALRRRMHDVPECALLIREFWKIAPHSKRQSPDARAAAIQEAIGHRMTRAFRENRDFKLHLLTDTQEPGDLLKSVREVFNRYVVYSANRDTIKDIFEWTQNDRWKSFWRTMTAQKGQAGIVGQVKPAVQRRDIEFLSPVEFVPPSHHHFEKLSDGTGWLARAEYIDAEELRSPRDVESVEWDDELPESLRIEAGDADETPSVTMRPVGAFAADCLQPADIDEYVHKSDVRAAFNAFLTDHDQSPWDFGRSSKTVAFSKRLKDAMPDDSFDGKKRMGEMAFVGLTFTSEGRTYYEQVNGDSTEGLQSTAEPIRGND